MTLLQMSFSGAVLILAVLLIRTLTVTRLPKQTFLILWGLVLFRLLVPFTISSPFSVYTLLSRNMPAAMLRQMSSGILVKEISDEDFPAALRSGQTKPASLRTTVPSDPVSSTLQSEQPPTFSSALTPLQSAGSLASQNPDRSMKNDTASSTGSSASAGIGASGTQTQAGRPVPLDVALFFLYCTGVVLCAAFFLFSYLRCQLEFRTALPVSDPMARQWLEQWSDAHPMRRKLSVRQSDRVDAPLTYGILHPVILLPKKTSWEDTASLHYILTHEAVHIRRLDAVTKLLMALALCLHWFNPLVWVMYLLFNKDLELACDEQVIHQLGENSKAAYAHMLLDLEARKSGLVPLYNHFGKTAIEERITAIMKTKKYSRPVILFAAGLIIGVTAAFATSATYTSAAEPDSSSSEAAQTSAIASSRQDPSMPDPAFTREEYDVLFLYDKETDRLISQRNIEQELVKDTVAKLEQQSRQYHQTALEQQRLLAIQEELSHLIEDEILNAQANREHTKRQEEALYSDREPRINDCANAEDYRSFFTLMTPDYASDSLTEFNNSLLDWANTHFDSYEKIREDCYRKEAFQEEPLIDLTEEQSRFIALTMMLSAEENRCQVQHLRTGRPEEDPVFHSYRLSKEESDGLLWCGFDYAFCYHIAGKDKVTVGGRDRLVGNVIDAIEDFWVRTDLEELQDMTREDVLDKLESIAARYSDEQITFTILEDQLYFEHMDERTYALQ